MEERLFFVGLAMGAFAWLSRRWSESQALDTPTKSGLWHGLFCGLSAFSAVWVIMMSLDSRAKFISIAAQAVSTTELYPSLAAGAIAGAIGFWRGFSRGAAPEGRRYFLGEDLEWAETVFSAVLLAAVLMYFVVQAFKIPSGSMKPTLLIGDHLLVNKFIYGVKMPYMRNTLVPIQDPKRGDIVVFIYPEDRSKDFIKRVIGIAGDTIEIRNKKIFLNGLPFDDKHGVYVEGTIIIPASIQPRDNFGPVTVPPGKLFVMGDNRDQSYDSRFWGFVDLKDVMGKAFIIYWSRNYDDYQGFWNFVRWDRIGNLLN